ncbi:serglycin [Anguilla rostrata]|uniref:Serglycin n=1 Tax=Anguilla anguilla TaxID=7936 RepID=A0A0E9X472_ANGAN|nr:serglycin [Anguilla anguilla]KAG5831236.1 hypothetical protein ANANG_G00301670 [Anguilla anguilla]
MGHLPKILVAFLVFCWLGQDALGAPAKGRYMWVRCRPDGRNANCVKEWGPWLSLPGPRERLPPSAVQDIMKASLDLDLQSTDGSGESGLFVESSLGDQLATDLGSGDLSSTDWGSGDQSSTDWGSGDQLSTDWGSGDQLSMDWQDHGLFTAEGRVQLMEGSGSEGSSSEGSGSAGSSLEGSGSVLDYTE